jgi:hypothetical protein
MDSMSTPRARTSTGTLPTACTASVWTTAPRARASRAISLTGCSTPVSFCASITETSVGPWWAPAASARRNTSGSTAPVSSTSTRAEPGARSGRARTGSVTAGCSTREESTITCAPACAAAKPRMARLLASVPPPVKRISSGSQPMSRATWARAVSTKARARRA